jgi:cytoskeletal protein RodZ
MIRIGEKLKEERKKRGLTLLEVAKATKIRESFLQAIEEGNYEMLPGSSYAHGFVKNYLEYLGFPIKEYLALFRREYDEKENRKLMPEGLMGKETISLKRFSFTQAIWLGGVVILALFTYLLFQYRAAFWSPQLVVSSPADNAVLSAQTIHVNGTTDPNTAVTVNTLPAYIDANGKFSKEIPVFPGDIVVSVKAVNSFGKITDVERHVRVKVQ